jgi:hypothetical protein
MLHRLLDHIHMVAKSEYDRALYRAMFLLAFHAFLRIGEITVRSSGGQLLVL